MFGALVLILSRSLVPTATCFTRIISPAHNRGAFIRITGSGAVLYHKYVLLVGVPTPILQKAPDPQNPIQPSHSMARRGRTSIGDCEGVSGDIIHTSETRTAGVGEVGRRVWRDMISRLLRQNSVACSTQRHHELRAAPNPLTSSKQIRSNIQSQLPGTHTCSSCRLLSSTVYAQLLKSCSHSTSQSPKLKCQNEKEH